MIAASAAVTICFVFLIFVPPLNKFSCYVMRIIDFLLLYCCYITGIIRTIKNANTLYGFVVFICHYLWLIACVP